MESTRTFLLLGLLLLYLTHQSDQQLAPKKKPTAKKDVQSQASVAIKELQQQINEIIEEMTVLKEQQALQTVCLKGTKINRKCFLADKLKKTYHTASEDCISKGGTLSTPLTSDENYHLSEYVRQSIGPNEKIWLGVNDMQTEGVWVDKYSSAVVYKNWEASGRSPQPDGGSAENCAVLSEGSGGKWLDENCRQERASVCEFNIV
ncbi:tetranectin [Chanos chanos]|uniref:Tetranectin n=1 Tax=Chanos chanos TaxID=29144 RepID=A0A6J2WLV0_CHACN|nr:tetranectin-like [Chanos chanos]